MSEGHVGDRLFVALDLPDGLRRQIVDGTRGVAEGCGARPVPAENLHATVVFLGDLPSERRAGVEEALAAARGASVAVGAGALRARPSASRARLLVVDLEDPTGMLVERWDRIASGVRAAAGMPPEGRPPWPHVTVARLRRPARVDVRGGWYPSEQMFDLPSATLYRSHLVRGGAPRYEALATVSVGPAAPAAGAAT